MAYKHLQLETDRLTARLILDRPPGNLLHIDMMEEINDALFAVRSQPTVEVLVLQGTGDVFCEGFDLSEHDKERVQRSLQVYSRIFETIRMMDVVSIAAVNGRAWGGGFELALGCNLILASDQATFALPEIEYGLFPPIASIVLPRVAPRRKAMEWILTGRRIPAGQLEHFGLVNRIVPADVFEDGLREFVAEITAKSGPVLQLAKQAQYEAYYSTYEEALYKVQNLYLRELIDLEDVVEGVRAHLEGRSPEWRNR